MRRPVSHRRSLLDPGLLPSFCGVLGRPYVDLDSILGTAALDGLHEEICYGLSQVEAGATGGTLKWMGVVSPEVEEDGYCDAMEVISKFSQDEFASFVALGEEPAQFNLDDYGSYTFGDETDHPFTTRQIRYLKYRYGVYFPWKVAYHLLDNVMWEDKNHGEGKAFGEEACRLFPRTVAYLRALPFREVGRVVLFGVEAHDHAPVHRDTKPGSTGAVAHNLTICPRADKRFYLADLARSTRLHVTSKLYWFNDMDWHGVEPDPYFRYSIRVDGIFESDFVRDLTRRLT